MLLDPSFSLLLANVVLVLHVGIAVFVVAGLLLIVVGNIGRWSWVNNFWFRVAHLAAIGVVVAESWLGFVCPLTTLEMWLRSRAGEASYGGGFIEHWLQQLLYYSAPPWVFIAAYTVFAVLVLASWWYFPPRSESRAHVLERCIQKPGRGSPSNSACSTPKLANPMRCKLICIVAATLNSAIQSSTVWAPQRQFS